MNRTELTLLISATIILAVIAGWCLRWLFVRLIRPEHGPATSDELAAELHAAEAARDAAIADRDTSVGELRNKLGQTEAELRAAMDGLGDARREAEDLRARLEAGS